jgi:hypothetical protein
MLGATVSCRPGRAHSGLPRRPTTCSPGTPHRAASVWVNEHPTACSPSTPHNAHSRYVLYKSQHHVRAIVVSLRVVQLGNDVRSGVLSHTIRDSVRDSSSSDNNTVECEHPTPLGALHNSWGRGCARGAQQGDMPLKGAGRQRLQKKQRGRACGWKRTALQGACDGQCVKRKAHRKRRKKNLLTSSMFPDDT